MAAKSGILGLGSRLYPGNMQRIFNKDLTRFMQSLSRERQNRASKSKAPLAGCGLPNPIKKIAHRMEFLFFKTCPNCIGRSWNSSTESPERQLHSWTTMFATEHFRHPSLHKTIWIEKTRQTRFLRYAYPCGINWNFNDSLYRPESLYDMLRNGEPEHLRMRWRDSSTKEKNARPPDPALQPRTKHVTPGVRPVRSLLDAVGPSLLSATDLASRYGIEGEICRPRNHMWQIPRLLTAPNRPCQFNVRIWWLKYTREKSFYLTCGKHWRSQITKCAHAPY